jgi:hypothetical protein
MKRTRTYRLAEVILCMPLLLTVCLGTDFAAAAPSGTMTREEVHYYREVVGTAVRNVQWRLRKGEHLTLTYTSPIEKNVTTTDREYETLSWHVIRDNGRTDFLARRDGDTIVVHGRFKGAPLDRTLNIDEAPWYQAISLSLRGLLASGDTDRVFWIIRYDTLKVHKIKAIKSGTERLQADEGRLRTLAHIRLTLTGLLAPFWKSDYWFTTPGDVFYRFQGPSGPPGAPMITITRVAG